VIDRFVRSVHLETYESHKPQFRIKFFGNRKLEKNLKNSLQMSEDEPFHAERLLELFQERLDDFLLLLLFFLIRFSVYLCYF
jgi:hypothetical protein